MNTTRTCARCCVTLTVLIGGLTAIPSRAHACHPVQVCIRFPFTADDLDAGDRPPIEDGVGMIDGYDVRVRVVPPPPEPSFETYLNTYSECIVFQTEYATGIKLLVYPEAFAGLDRAIRIRAYANGDDLENDILADPWLISLKDTVVGNSPHWVEIPPSDLSKMFALAIYVTGRMEWNTMTSQPLTGSHEMRVATYEPEPMSTEDLLGAYGLSDKVYANPFLVQRKFAVAHEMGHWYHLNWSSAYQPVDFEYEATDVDCQFADAGGANILHGIRSAEYASGAFYEGLGHVISTRVFDNEVQTDAIFKYYKDIDIMHPMGQSYTEFVQDGSLVSMIGGTDPDTLGGRSAWVENMCEADWTYTEGGALQEILSEIDWQRFWWQFMMYDAAGVPTEKPDFWHIFRLLQYYEQAESPDGIGWPELHSIISDPNNADVYPYLERFEYFSDANGVYNGGE